MPLKGLKNDKSDNATVCRQQCIIANG